MSDNFLALLQAQHVRLADEYRSAVRRLETQVICLTDQVICLTEENTRLRNSTVGGAKDMAVDTERGSSALDLGAPRPPPALEPECLPSPPAHEAQAFLRLSIEKESGAPLAFTEVPMVAAVSAEAVGIRLPSLVDEGFSAPERTASNDRAAQMAVASKPRRSKESSASGSSTSSDKNSIELVPKELEANALDKTSGGRGASASCGGTSLLIPEMLVAGHVAQLRVPGPPHQAGRFPQRVSMNTPDEEEAKDGSASASSGAESTEESDEDAFDAADCWLIRKATSASSSRKRTLVNWVSSNRGSFVSGTIDFLGLRNPVQPAPASESGETDSGSKAGVNKVFNINGGSWFIIEPFSQVHLCREVLSFLFIVYDVITLPLEAFRPSAVPFTIVMQWILRFWWTTDIGFSFLTGYFDDEGCLVTDGRKIARRYICRKMFLDLLVVSGDWLEMVVGVSATGILKGWRAFRLVRLVRMKKAKKIHDHIDQLIFRRERLLVLGAIGKMLIILATLCHLIACGWAALSLEDVGIRAPELLGDDYSVGERYVQSFHLAISIFFGEHTVTLVNTMERVFVSGCFFVTFTLQIWMVSFITTAMTQLEMISQSRTLRLAELTRFMERHAVRRDLRVKVERNAVAAMYDRERNAPEESIQLLKLISEPLMIDLHFEIRWQILSWHPFLRLYTEINLVTMRNICHTCIVVKSVAKDDTLFHDLESPLDPAVFFVTSGSLTYVSPGQELKVLIRGHWIAEAVLWCDGWVHCGTLQAAEASQLLCLKAHLFRDVVSSVSSAHARDYAIAFVSYLNSLQACELSDIGEFNTLIESLGPDLAKIFPVDFQLLRSEAEVAQDNRRTNIGGDRKTMLATLRSSIGPGGFFGTPIVPMASEGSVNESEEQDVFEPTGCGSLASGVVRVASAFSSASQAPRHSTESSDSGRDSAAGMSAVATKYTPQNTSPSGSLRPSKPKSRFTTDRARTLGDEVSVSSSEFQQPRNMPSMERIRRSQMIVEARRTRATLMS